MNETTATGDPGLQVAAPQPPAVDLSAPLLRLEGLEKTYRAGSGDSVAVLAGASLTLERGQITALVAPSGAGKSTLLHIAGLLDTADAGRIEVDGIDMTGLSDGARTAARRAKIGFVYQFHHLLPEFSAAENIILPQLANGVPRGQAERRAQALLDRVGLAPRAHHRPAEMSGGEQQRVAFCRALANNPLILLADEPTGNLDPGTSDQVFEALVELVRETGLTALVATHNLDLASRMDRRLRLHEGQIQPA